MNDDAARGTLHGFVAELTAMRAGDDAHEVYEEWAPTYEADLVDGYGYTAHRIAAAGHPSTASLDTGNGAILSSCRASDRRTW